MERTRSTAEARKVGFDGSSGKLAGVLELPQGQLRGVALFAHCFTCTKDVRAAREIARTLCSDGFGVLRFDFAGLGASEGAFSDTTFSSNLDDLQAAEAFLRREIGPAELIVGHSLGGAAAIVAAGAMPSVKAVATIGAPAETQHVSHQFADRVDDIRRDGEAEVTLAGRPFTMRRAFLDDLDGDRVLDAARRLKKPLLLLHAPTDSTVGVQNAQAIFMAALHPKSFISLPGADHLLSRPSDARYAAKVISAWSGAYFG